jgi:hypothetical protein
VDFPAFIIIDDKGNDFFKELNLGGGPRRPGERRDDVRPTPSSP